MGSDGVVVMDVSFYGDHHFSGRQVLVDIDFIVLQGSEESFGPDVVQRLSFPVHGNLDAAAIQQVKIALVGEVTSLVGVDDFWLPVAQCTP